MSDIESAMQEFRALDEQRKMTGLTPEAEQRWQELGMALGVDLSAAAQPQGYYGADGLWYAYPPGYDPNAAWQQQQQQPQWDPNQQYAQQGYAQPGYEQQQEQPQGFYDQNTGIWYQWDPAQQAYYDPNTGTWYPQQQQQWADPSQQQPQTWAPPQPSAPQWSQPAAPAWNAPVAAAPPAPAWNPPAPAAPAWNPPAPTYTAPEPVPAPKPSVPRAPVFVPPTFTIKPRPSVPAPPPPTTVPAPKPAPAPVVAAAEEVMEIGDDVMEIGDEEVEELPLADAAPMVSTGLKGLTSDTGITKLDEATARMLAEEPTPALEDIAVEPEAPVPATTNDEFFPSVDALTHSAPVAESFSTPIASTLEPVSSPSELVEIETMPLEPEVALEASVEPAAAEVELDATVEPMISAEVEIAPAVEPMLAAEVELDATVEPLPAAEPMLSAEVELDATIEAPPAAEPMLSAEVELDATIEAPPAAEPMLSAEVEPTPEPQVWTSSPTEPALELSSIEAPAVEEPSISVSPELMAEAAPAPVPPPLSARVTAEVAPSPEMIEEPSISVSPDLMQDVPAPEPKSISMSTRVEAVVRPTPAILDEPSISVSDDLMADVAPPRTDITQELPPVVLPPEMSEAHPGPAPEVRFAPEPIVAAEPPALGEDDIPPTQPKLARVLADGSTEVPLLQIRLAPPALSPPVAPMPATAPPPAPLPMPMSLSQPDLVPMPPPSASVSADLIVGEEPVLEATVEPLLEATVEPMIEAEVAGPELVPVPAWSDVPSPPPMAPAQPPVEAPSWDDVPEPVAMEPEPITAVPVESPSWDDVPEPVAMEPEPLPAAPSESWDAEPIPMDVEPLPPEPPPPAPMPAPRASGSSFDLLAMSPEAAPRIPIAPPAQPAPAAASPFGNSWENQEPEPQVGRDPSLFGNAFTPAPDEFGGGSDDKVELASNFDFVAPSSSSSIAVEEVSIDADPGDFVVENATAAELATDVRASTAPPPAEEKLELASNFDFLDHSQLTSTGESWSDDRSSLALEGEEEGEVIQGTVLEEDIPVDTGDSWGTAVSQPSPVPAPATAPARPPPVHVPPLVAPPAPPPRLAAPAATAPAVAPAAPPAAAGGLVIVPGEHRVILHTVEGQVKRGAIVDAKLGEPQVHLLLASGGNEVLPRERVKALFFMLAPGARPPGTAGAKVRVTFKDGRQVAGFSSDHQTQAAGFFVVPADNRTNTERIFIFRHAVQSVAVDS